MELVHLRDLREITALVTEHSVDPHLDIIEETKFKLSSGQKALSAVLIISAIIFGSSTFVSSRESISQARILSQAESPAASIIFTQRETLVYVTNFAQWLAGGVDRRKVQISRALLAQRLNVIDTEGTAIGSRLSPEFLRSLKQSDLILASSRPGFLGEREQESLLLQAKPVLDSIVLNARQLIESYQHAVDNQIHKQVVQRERAARINLALLMWVGILVLALFIWIGGSVRRQYRRGRIAIRDEKMVLEAVRDELVKTQESLARMQTLSDAKNDFISTINHELRTPLTSIIGYIELLRKRIKKVSPIEEISPLVDTLDRNALALMDLVESMLSISRLDSDNYVVEFSKLDVAKNIEASLFVLDPIIKAKKILVHFSAPHDQFIIEGNYGQISQVFLNLITNAIKFSPEQSEIDINLDRLENESGLSFVSAAIIDHGIGIPAEDIPQLFTRFFRARNAIAEHIPGTGLGLAIVQKIIQIHGGTIDVNSELDKGTTFELRFPEAISKAEGMIAARRLPVLERALSRINAAPESEIAAAAHEIGGAIGFYTFVAEGDLILKISRDLESATYFNPEIAESKRREILTILHSAKARLEALDKPESEEK